jgi:uncharacterized protein involved in type VI secretion and phage assembly
MEPVTARASRQTQTKYYGKYRGFVVDNQDPEKKGRLRVRVPSILGETETGWALPCLPFGGLQDQGFFMIPEVDSQIWVEFEEGNLSHPIWTGVFWQQTGDIPSEAAKDEPTTRIIKTPSGHILQFEDESGNEQIRLYHTQDAHLQIDNNGSIELKDASSNTLKLDANQNKITLEDANGNSLVMDTTGTTVTDSNGNKIEMAPAGITVEGTIIEIKGTQIMLGGSGGEPIIKGQSFLTLFATHMHTCSVPGSPTSPPIPQGEFSTLSMTSMTK